METAVATNNELFFCKTDNDNSESEECEMKNGITELDASNIITLKNDDGTETNYLPFYQNGQIIMTPITLIKEEPIEIEDQDSEKNVLKIKEESTSTPDNLNKSIQFIECHDGKLLRTVPTKPEPKKSTRVPPNTYKKTLISNAGQGLIRYGRKHLLVDAKTMISAKQFKHQLTNSNDLVKTLELAPKTKQQMRHMIDGYTKLFAYPAHSMSKQIRDLYTRHCTSRNQPNFETLDDMTLLPIGYEVDVDRSKIKRITRPRRKPVEQIVLAEAEEDSVTESLSGNDIMILNTQTAKLSDGQYLTFTDYVNNTNDTQIVVIEDETDNTNHSVYDQKNIEVLLAAAESRESANIDGNYEIYVTTDQEMIEQEDITGNSQIIIVEDGELID